MAKENDDIVADAINEFEKVQEAWSFNHKIWEEDVRFALNGEQWPEKIKADRLREGRPVLTINRLKPILRQVVNDSRQNKPQIKVRAVDSNADVQTAEILSGLIRSIERSSDADVAYDTAIEYSAAGGFGFIRVDLEHAYYDSFDMDIKINRVANPLSVYGDPNSMAADSSDWEKAFVVDAISQAEFKRQYGEKSQVDWSDDAWGRLEGMWRNDGETCLVGEWWTVDYVDEKLLQFTDLQDGSFHVYKQRDFEGDPDLQMLRDMGRLEFNRERDTKCREVMQRIMTGVEILEERKFPGRYIPIIPVYGDEFVLKGRRHFQGLTHHAKDAARMMNYWRTNSTELVALAPRVPYIGPVGSFDTDQARWETANSQSHAYLEFDDKGMPPQRQPLDMGVAAGSLQEAMNASDDIKAITGIYDASLGARSNETSGKAIMARQREGDVATFHFNDNLTRAIRHVARVVLDLIPHVYDTPRIIRVLGEDDTERQVQVNEETPETDKEGNPVTDDLGNFMMTMHDLTVGKYDIAVDTGPSFTTRREEAAMQMTEMLRSFPDAAPFIADIMAKNFDWPNSEEIAERLKALVPGQQEQGIPPEIQQMIEQGQQRIAELEQENEQLKAGHDIDAQKAQADMSRAQTAQFDAETKRMKAVDDAQLQRMNRMTRAPVFTHQPGVTR